MLAVKTISVFYDSEGYPFKDAQRTVRYPITSGTFAGSHNTKEVRFYVRDIGGTNGISWVVVSKLPNGKIGYEVCSNVQTDSELGEQYLSFDLSAYYTQVKGDLYLALRGYQGEIEFTNLDEEGNPLAGNVYRVAGDPLIEVTGTIKLSINYSPMVNTGTQVLPTDIDRIIAALSDYLLIENGIIFTHDKSEFSLNDYEVGTVFFEYKLTSGVYQGRFWGVGEEQGTKYWEELRFSRLDTQDINIYGSAKVFGELRITNESRIVYGDNKLKFIVNGHILALSTSGVLTIDGNELAQKGYLDNNFYTKTESDNRYDIQSFVSLGSGSSGTLTSDELEKVQRPNAVIKWSDGFYTKYLEQGSYIYFKDEDNPIGIGSGKWAISNTSIRITKSTGEWTRNSSSIISYTASAVDNIVSTLKANSFQVVASLPATGQEGIIYLVETSVGSGVYNQYIWESGAYISLGTTQIDLSGYVEKTQTIAGIDLQDNITSQELTDALAYATNTDIDNLF